MLNYLIKTYLFILMLTSCANLYAQSYNLTININGEEFYSDENGFSDKRSASKSNKHSVSTSDNLTVSKSDNRSVSKRKKEYTDLVAKAAERHQVDAKLVHSVIQAESAYNAKAVSSAGAVGLMQLMPGTAKRFGVGDRRDPYQNIDGGTRYLKYLLRLFDSDLNLVVAAYNAGENAVIKYNNTIPPYSETRHYVKKVLSLTDYMKRGSGSVYPAPRSEDTSEYWDNSGYTIEFN
jgi:soluble lytic murein transglycosylase-like protein